MLEIQIHPGDVSRTARYYFLTPSKVRWLGVALGLGVVLLLASGWWAPKGVQGLWLLAKTAKSRRVNLQLREKHRELEQRQAALGQKLEEAAQELQRRALVLGATPVEVERIVSSHDLRMGVQLALQEADRLVEWARAHREMVASLPAICPLPAGSFQMTSGFGVRVSPFTGTFERHKGVDLAAPLGLPVKAPGNGRVLFAGRVGPENPPWARLGNVVVLEHGPWYVTIFAHLKEVLTRPGQTVRRGEVVGLVGNTGWSTAPHLHYEVRRKVAEGNLVPTDPLFFMLDYPGVAVAKGLGGEASAALDLLPEEEHWPWLKTKHSRR